MGDRKIDLPGTGAILLAGVLLVTVCGCSVQEHKSGHAENVELRTPIGGLEVHTNSLHGPDVGLPVYPGAVESGNLGSDSGSADIHVSFGDWRLTVKAVEYRSDDSEDKIIAFYKNAMSEYGGVLTCKDKIAIGTPVKTANGLTCAQDHEYDVDLGRNANRHFVPGELVQLTGTIKLLAGSPDEQHMVEVTPTSGGTRFSIVMVELPHKDRTD